MNKISKRDTPEFIGQIIDSFEDFLEAKKVDLHNPERVGDEFAAIIYGTDYDEVRNQIFETLKNWELIEV